MTEGKFTRAVSYSTPETGCYEDGYENFYDGYYTEQGLKALKNRNREKPLLLNMMYLAPHPPFDIPQPCLLYTSGIGEFSRGYKEAMEAIEEKQVLGENQVICYETVKNGGHHFEYSIEMEKRLKNYIRLGDYNKSKSEIEAIYDEAFHQNPISPEAGKLLLLNLIKTVNEIAKERNCLLYTSRCV